jgi:protease-4
MGCGALGLASALISSLVLNVLFCSGLLAPAPLGSGGQVQLAERFHSGGRTTSDKIAIITVSGPILEGMLGFAHQQIRQAARDDAVKAVVLRIDSPGGSITASDDLLLRLQRLRDGESPGILGRPKPIVAHMGSVCASGGYYIAMAAAQSDVEPRQKLFAERSTITGSIGVYASLPNARELADKVGVTIEMIKAGDIKGSGSPFHELTPQERQPWQDMVDHAYAQFVGVVEAGRPKLKGRLMEPLFPPKVVARFDNRGQVVDKNAGEYTRRRADGGIFTAEQARDAGLIDAIGPIDSAIAAVAAEAGLREWKAVEYEKPQTILNVLTGIDVAGAVPKPDVMPRLWYLMPYAEPGVRLQPLAP